MKDIRNIMESKPSAPSPVLIRQVESPEDLAAVIKCFHTYTEWLDEDLSHQNYESELAGLPGKTCSGLRRVATCDASVESPQGQARPSLRGNEEAEQGYNEVFLDTLARMEAAIKLYKSEGFLEAEPYNNSPYAGTVYLAKELE
ncbi:hypothetical protein LMH87_001926 [Akanthomyces muscarius]|uniref:Uncharacterized protein n=1 Tax=Akanthomyces muscarius TaxID=2231603 RepID=A0A9W8Q5A4_AKAMU|nr:hypothetical protein LMH87_001926 [Akanthomyces muscarius]KAJ4147405.1 hypothetical protein LMH87_001926 [Akanthomyces muscarius]